MQGRHVETGGNGFISGEEKPRTLADQGRRDCNMVAFKER